MKVWTKEQRVALGLSEKESKLLDVLGKYGPLHTSALAYHASLPRVTTMRILKILLERGFVVRKEESRAVVWSLVDPALLEKRLVHLFEIPGVFKRRNIGLSEVGNLTIYRGVTGMIESNERMLIAHAGERVLAIEPNGIWKHFGAVQSDDMLTLNLLWKEKQILIEMIAEEGFEKIIDEQINPELGKSFLSLATDIRVVPQGMLDSATEVLIFRDQILFTDWAYLVGVEIKNPSTVRVMKAMFRMLQNNGRKYKR